MIIYSFTELFKCDFEDDSCNMRSDVDETLIFRRASGFPGTVGTGPHSGAQMSQFYIYVESSQFENGVMGR